MGAMLETKIWAQTQTHAPSNCCLSALGSIIGRRLPCAIEGFEPLKYKQETGSELDICANLIPISSNRFQMLFHALEGFCKALLVNLANGSRHALCRYNSSDGGGFGDFMLL